MIVSCRVLFLEIDLNIDERRAVIKGERSCCACRRDMCDRQQSSMSCPDSVVSEDVELSSQEDEEEEGAL